MSQPLVILKAVSLAPYTTLKVGGHAEYFTTVTSMTELQEAVTWARNREQPIYILGSGSNILVSDGGVLGLVIQIALVSTYVDERDERVLYTVGAGGNFDECVAITVARGWWGLENLSHIPGTIGATPIQNVGAYGVEIADVIESVSVYDTVSDKAKDFSAAECQFGYRHSLFKAVAGRYVVTAVTFRLSKTPQPRVTYKDVAHLASHEALTPQLVRETVIAVRSAKFPDWHREGTAGSFFKNPVIALRLAEALATSYPDVPVYPVSATTAKVSLGYILDKVCGLKGYRVGGVRLYEQQALVLVADGGSTATTIDEFADSIAKKVLLKTGISIEREVVTWE